MLKVSYFVRCDGSDKCPERLRGSARPGASISATKIRELARAKGWSVSQRGSKTYTFCCPEHREDLPWLHKTEFWKDARLEQENYGLD